LVHAYDEGMAGTMRIAVRTGAKQVHIDFSDDGKGIAAENIPKVFDPFFTTRRGAGGSGLGLNIVFNMVTRKLQGRITVSSVQGQGTVFKMELPMAVDANAQKPKEASEGMLQSYQKTLKAN